MVCKDKLECIGLFSCSLENERINTYKFKNLSSCLQTITHNFISKPSPVGDGIQVLAILRFNMTSRWRRVEPTTNLRVLTVTTMFILESRVSVKHIIINILNLRPIHLRCFNGFSYVWLRVHDHLS